MYIYSDPKRENDPHALPDIELWEDIIVKLDCLCGSSSEIPQQSVGCSNCGSVTTETESTNELGWFYWACFPGCLPDGDIVGPFESYKDAMADAQKEHPYLVEKA